uniref:Family with sequence similarity 131 member A n=1 Tax=Leptobrachium leishanense TaxID=445787 RepID=A0A8C5PN12_9ANUR
MLPKSRRALTIHEITALARSSLHGISQVVKDHVTKPTAMAQGRVAHLIEWKGWSKPSDSPAALETHFNSYSHLSEGEQEARFAAGVAEQFAIAEAKLRAWSSVEGDDSTDDSYDEDLMPPMDTAQPSAESWVVKSRFVGRFLRISLTSRSAVVTELPLGELSGSGSSTMSTSCISVVAAILDSGGGGRECGEPLKNGNKVAVFAAGRLPAGWEAWEVHLRCPITACRPLEVFKWRSGD